MTLSYGVVKGLLANYITFPSLFKKRISVADNTSGGSALQRLFWLEEFLTHDIGESVDVRVQCGRDMACFRRTTRTACRNTDETLR